MGYYTGMRLVIATPLYPPDIAEPAPYAKELAARLAGEHTVTVVAYGALPEAVSGVSVISVNKRRPLPWRLIAYTFALRRAARQADFLYAENGASVELPAGLVALLTGKPLLLHMGDSAAHERSSRGGILGATLRFAAQRAQDVITDMPLPRPEIVPLRERPVRVLEAYEQSWKSHLAVLETAFNHYERR